MAEKQVKTLEKLFAQESQADEDKIKRAMKEMVKMEKAYQKSTKVSPSAFVYFIRMRCSLTDYGAGDRKGPESLGKGGEREAQDAVQG